MANYATLNNDGTLRVFETQATAKQAATRNGKVVATNLPCDGHGQPAIMFEGRMRPLKITAADKAEWYNGTIRPVHMDLIYEYKHLYKACL